jgi:hypothetical protein
MTKTYKLVLRITYILISQIDYRLDFLSLLEIMIEINHSKCISTYSRNKRIMNGIIIFFGLTIAVLSLFFSSDHIIGNQKAFASGSVGYGNGFVHSYRPALGHYYNPGYPINPCGGGPYSTINGQIVCTPG